MHLDNIGRLLGPRLAEPGRRRGLALVMLCLLLTACSSGAASDAARDEARDAGRPQQLAAEQATRIVERYFPATATPAPTESQAPALGALAITYGFTPGGTPDGSYASVPAGSGTVYAAAKLSGLAPGQIVSAIVEDAWGNEIATPEVRIDSGPAERWLALPIPLSADVAPGEYGVYVFCNDRTLGSLAFGVTGAGTSAQLLPEAPANPQVRSTLPPPGMAPAEAPPTATFAPST
jgi:hypothetical protein